MTDWTEAVFAPGEVESGHLEIPPDLLETQPPEAWSAEEGKLEGYPTPEFTIVPSEKGCRIRLQEPSDQTLAIRYREASRA